mgnify:CR=1 FL=1
MNKTEHHLLFFLDEVCIEPAAVILYVKVVLRVPSPQAVSVRSAILNFLMGKFKS